MELCSDRRERLRRQCRRSSQARIDAAEFGFASERQFRRRMIAVIINITLERQTEDHLDRFEAAVRRHPEIRECFLMTGGSDYLLRVEVASAGEFERIHKEILSTLPGVLRIHSSFSIRNVLATRTRGRR
jgi:DNA-binding Lrp family transcriptional regulator